MAYIRPLNEEELKKAREEFRQRLRRTDTASLELWLANAYDWREEFYREALEERRRLTEG